MHAGSQRATRSSGYTPSWATPEAVYGALHVEFSFTMDPCPIGGALGLMEPWTGRVYCNPPYSEIPKWWARRDEPDLSVYLLPARTDTRWFHEALREEREIRFIRGRLRFGTGPHNAPFPSCIIVCCK